MKMTSHKVLAGLATLLFVVACSKEGPTRPPPGESARGHAAAEEVAPGVAAVEPERTYDYAKMANGMLVLIADAPECQKYRDELQAIASLPPGTKPDKDPSKVVAEAHDARCSTRSREQP